MKILLTLLLLIATSVVHATAQRPDSLILDGERVALFTNPFVQFLRRDDNWSKMRPHLKAKCSGSWLGFTAEWEIKDDFLYHTAIKANPCNKIPDEVPVQIFFPESNGPIVASWYSGSLVVPRGKRIKYVHWGYLSEYESYTIIEVKDGEVLSRKEVKELPAKPQFK